VCVGCTAFSTVTPAEPALPPQPPVQHQRGGGSERRVRGIALLVAKSPFSQSHQLSKCSLSSYMCRTPGRRGGGGGRSEMVVMERALRVAQSSTWALCLLQSFPLQHTIIPCPPPPPLPQLRLTCCSQAASSASVAPPGIRPNPAPAAPIAPMPAPPIIIGPPPWGLPA
jgi:hypothetical protein